MTRPDGPVTAAVDAAAVDAAAVDAAAEMLGNAAVRDEPVGSRTTYRVGGAADLFVSVNDDEQLALVSETIRTTCVDILVLGNGSNLLVRDGGFRGLVVALGGAFAEVSTDTESHTVVAGGAAAYPVVARRSAAVGLSGMEWAVGIPGTVGGAVAMNAGGHGSATADRLVNATVLTLRTGDRREASGKDLGFGYRRSGLGPGDVVLDATFACSAGEAAHAAREIATIVRWRRDHQPGGRNAGSVFTNPPGDAAGRLVELAGLKGCRIGSAEVSQRHANFIQVDEGGSADDVVALVERAREVVAERTGVVLATELRIVGEPAPANSAASKSTAARSAAARPTVGHGR